jgi:uncharacterized membrane protein
MKVTYRTLGILALSAELLLTAGCQSPDGRPDNTGTGALVGGLFGAVVGAAAGGRHAGRNALIGGLAGAVAGGLVGHMIDRDQQARLQAQSPQTLATIQHNDAVYQQQQQAAQAPAQAPTQPSAQTPAQAQDAPPADKPIPLTVDDIKALDSAGVKKDVIIAEIERSKAVYTQADITALQQSNPNIDPAVIEAMKKTSSS